jgi:hypothetical protein
MTTSREMVGNSGRPDGKEIVEEAQGENRSENDSRIDIRVS